MNEDESVYFYWIDAIDDPQNSPGVVFLFGKILNKKEKKYESVCIKVTKILRDLYFVPTNHLEQDNKQ